MGIPIVYNVVYIFYHILYTHSRPFRNYNLYLPKPFRNLRPRRPRGRYWARRQSQSGREKIARRVFPARFDFFVFVPSICLWVSEDEKFAFCDKFDWKTSKCSMNLLS